MWSFKLVKLWLKDPSASRHFSTEFRTSQTDPLQEVLSKPHLLSVYNAVHNKKQGMNKTYKVAKISGLAKVQWDHIVKAVKHFHGRLDIISAELATMAEPRGNKNGQTYIS